MDIMIAIASATKALEALKAIQDINKNYDAATWKAKVAELMSDIADMKMAMIDSRETIQILEKEKEALTKKVVFKAENTVNQRGFIYEVFENGEIADLPFCQNCMTQGNYVRIMHSPIGGSSFCPNCKTHYQSRSITHQ